MSNAWIDNQERVKGWPLFYREGKDIPKSEEYPHHRIVVTAGLHDLAPKTQRPYWSVTAEIINKRKTRNSDEGIESAGAMHETILVHFPELAPVVALHLSDDHGGAGHGHANAYYWLGLTRYTTWERTYGKPEDLPAIDVLARHLRISEDDARAMANRYPVSDRGYLPTLAYEIDGHRERWQRESDAAVELLRGMGAKPYRGSQW